MDGRSSWLNTGNGRHRRNTPYLPTTIEALAYCLNDPAFEEWLEASLLDGTAPPDLEVLVLRYVDSLPSLT